MASKRVAPLRAFLTVEVQTKHAEVLLMGCCFSSGLTDSTIYNAYNTFVSMQTGNTIFVGLGPSNQNPQPYGWARSLISISCFIIGSWLFASLNRLLRPRLRGTLMLSFLLQTLMIIVAAGLVNGGIIPGRPDLTATDEELSNGEDVTWSQVVPIMLLSLQSAGQIVSSRALGFNEIPTVVVTSLLCDLMSDPKLFHGQNEKRNRRILAFLLTLAGAIAGGWMTKASGDIYVALWVAAGLKMGIVVAWALWKPSPTGLAA